LPFKFSIPSGESQTEITVEPGSSVVFVGANGGGKTRLAVWIETGLELNAHRISAHRALALNPSVAKINEQAALAGLKTGDRYDSFSVSGPAINKREIQRWGSKMATSLLNDFDSLIQVLFADQANKALETHHKVRAGDFSPASPTKFDRLVEIWDHLLPHRKLQISGDDIQVTIQGSNTPYNASEMSDGERAIFYMIGQTLAASENSLLIFD
jgi:hypothetical protein